MQLLEALICRSFILSHQNLSSDSRGKTGVEYADAIPCSLFFWLAAIDLQPNTAFHSCWQADDL